MIRILKQRVTNFAAYQNPVIPYDGETTLIGGRNGAGKSTFLEAMRYAFGNKDLQHNEADRTNYYLQRGTNKVTASTITLSNRDANDRPGAFKHLGIKAECVTVGVVFIPQSDGSKKGKYGILPGDVGMQEFVETVKSTGTGWKEHVNRLSTCHLGKDVVDHVMVKQGTAGDLAKATPRELYLRVLSQGGHVEVKERYEEAVEDSKKAQKELEAREMEKARASIQYEAASAQVASLERYEAKVDEKARLLEELEGARLHRLVREQHRLRKDLKHAEAQLKLLPAQIVGAGVHLEEAEEAVRELTQLVNDYDGQLQEAEDNVTTCVQAKAEALAALTEAMAARTAWFKVQYAPSPEEARTRAANAERAADDARRRLDAAQEAENQVQRVLDGINGRPSPPPDTQAMLDAVPEARSLPSIIGEASGFVEAALGDRLWSIVVPEGKLDAAKAAGAEQGFQRPILIEGTEPWKQWMEDASEIRTDFGIVVAPATEPRLLSHGPDAVKEATRELARRSQARVDAEKASKEANAAWVESQQVVTDADLRDSLPREAPDTTEATRIHAEAEAAEAEARKKRDGLRKRSQQRLRDELVQQEEERDALASALEELQAEEATHNQTVESTPLRLEEIGLDLQALDDLPATVQESVLDLDASWRRQSDIQGDLRIVTKFLEETEAPPPDCRDRKANLHSRLEKLETKINDAKEALEGTLDALREAQEHYGQRANVVLQQFQKRFEKVCRGFDVEPTVRYDRIKPDMEAEQINSASLHIEIKFGNQPSLKLRGGLSGGQGAVAGMLLRICMMNSDATGFFVIDEPYQSLDNQNVRLVSDFLSKSQYQVILVVPNSDDPNQYRGVLRGVRVRPKNEDGISPVPDMIGIAPDRDGVIRVAA